MSDKTKSLVGKTIKTQYGKLSFNENKCCHRTRKAMIDDVKEIIRNYFKKERKSYLHVCGRLDCDKHKRVIIRKLEKLMEMSE